MERCDFMKFVETTQSTRDFEKKEGGHGMIFFSKLYYTCEKADRTDIIFVANYMNKDELSRS